MDVTGEHYAKWNKPGSEGQIPYDLTFKWNIINKTEKHTKYNQKHGNKEQTDSDQTGLGWEITGESRGRVKSRNMYKGSTGIDNGVGIDWESGGRQGRGEQQGKMWDNCNWTKIKK